MRSETPFFRSKGEAEKVVYNNNLINFPVMAARSYLRVSYKMPGWGGNEEQMVVCPGGSELTSDDNT